MNLWKWISILLITLNVLVVIWVFSMLSADYDTINVNESSGTDAAQSETLEAVLPNNTVEVLINDYLTSVGDVNINLSISTDAITLHSTDDMLGMTVNTRFDLVPVTNENQIIFEVDNIDIGSLPLSQDALYTIIVGASDLPEGVSFSTDSKALLIDTAIFQEEFSSGIQIESIDYQNDQWYFSIER